MEESFIVAFFLVHTQQYPDEAVSQMKNWTNNMNLPKLGRKIAFHGFSQELQTQKWKEYFKSHHPSLILHIPVHRLSPGFKKIDLQFMYIMFLFKCRLVATPENISISIWIHSCGLNRFVECSNLSKNPHRMSSWFKDFLKSGKFGNFSDFPKKSPFTECLHGSRSKRFCCRAIAPVVENFRGFYCAK